MMNFVHGLKRNNSLIIKRKNKKYLNSAIYQKDFKKVLISFDDRSNIISQRQNKINSNNLNEESKANFNNNSNGLIRLEKEKNNLRKNLILPLKFNNPNKKLNTERGKISELLSSGFVDTVRYLHPDETGRYSWWSYRFNARKNNAGWRIDYFIVSDRIRDKIRNADILSDIYGSDHCPVLLDIDI